MVNITCRLVDVSLKYHLSYADLFLSEWEQTALAKCQKIPLLNLRYLDDIFGLWGGTVATFEDFVGVFNSHHP